MPPTRLRLAASAADVIVTPQVRAGAALRQARPDSYASHHTAAELCGLPVPHDDHTHITVPEHGERLRRQGVKSHLGQAAARRTLRHKIPLSTPEQTFIDLAATGVKLVDLVVLGDAMLKAELTTIPTLIGAIETWQWYGTRLALRAARLLREGVESPMETRVRLLLVLAGLPEPTVNVIVRAEDGSWRMRFDLCYLGQRLIVEYDGRRHAESPEQWERDIYRREDLDRMDYRLLIVCDRKRPSGGVSDARSSCPAGCHLSPAGRSAARCAASSTPAALLPPRSLAEPATKWQCPRPRAS